MTDDGEPRIDADEPSDAPSVSSTPRLDYAKHVAVEYPAKHFYQLMPYDLDHYKNNKLQIFLNEPSAALIIAFGQV